MVKDSVMKYNCCGSNLASSMFQFPGFAASKVVPSLNVTPASYQPGDCPNLVFKSGGCGFSQRSLIGPSNGASSEEMHEDSDEIDALLYSESEEEAITGHLPTEEVASSLTVLGKRKRIFEPNISMVDTASSVGAYYQWMVPGYGEEDAESSCEGGGEQFEDEDELVERKLMKRERILETVELLRRIIPCCQRSDAAAVIDDAISYLESLKLHALALEATTIMKSNCI